MSGRGREIAILELHGRALYDIAQVLEHAGEAEKRVLRVLELLRQLVPYEQCALLQQEAGSAPRILAIPALSPEEKNLLTDEASDFGREEQMRRARNPAPIRA
jgi:hypothetical protein